MEGLVEEDVSCVSALDIGKQSKPGALGGLNAWVPLLGPPTLTSQVDGGPFRGPAAPAAGAGQVDGARRRPFS